jgi:hypothetical protein
MSPQDCSSLTSVIFWLLKKRIIYLLKVSLSKKNIKKVNNEIKKKFKLTADCPKIKEIGTKYIKYI